MNTIAAKDATLKKNEDTLKKLDAVLEEAGKKSIKYDDDLKRKNAQLKRITTMLDECRMHINAKDKHLIGLEEELILFLIKLRDPELRPKEAVVTEINTIKNTLQKILASTPKDIAINDHPLGLVAHHKTKIKYIKKIQKDPACDHERRMAHKLRGHNHSLLDELNDLRLDRLSLRQRLQKAEFENKSPLVPSKRGTTTATAQKNSPTTQTDTTKKYYNDAATQQKIDALFQPDDTSSVFTSSSILQQRKR
uniref:Uncharacterized protein n=1 Tax=Aureoumbra lagunensis TaxID=44058 RepID=A0A7S3NDX4_9STRA